MVSHDKTSVYKALAYIVGGLSFFLIIMHQAAQAFR
jgi:hypothetical protein